MFKRKKKTLSDSYLVSCCLETIDESMDILLDNIEELSKDDIETVLEFDKSLIKLYNMSLKEL